MSELEQGVLYEKMNDHDLGEGKLGKTKGKETLPSTTGTS